MLYEYLAGISPFDGQDMVKKIIEGQAPDITSKVNVPPAVARVVRRAMAADLRKRYGWADRLADELVELLASDLGHDPYAADEGDVLEHLRKAGAAAHDTPATVPDGQTRAPARAAAGRRGGAGARGQRPPPVVVRRDANAEARASGAVRRTAAPRLVPRSASTTSRSCNSSRRRRPR